jgi:hypothetical protein
VVASSVTVAGSPAVLYHHEIGSTLEEGMANRRCLLIGSMAIAV